MECSCFQLNDLPDEILMIILKNLNNLAVLYSLFGVNKRLNKILHDSIFTNCLTLLRTGSNDFIYPLSNQILDRFCLHILPEIHCKIKCLNIESSSMGRVLRATNYPNLYGLGLYNIQEEKAITLLADEALFSNTLKKQISSLVIRITDNRERNSSNQLYALIFTQIFAMFTNLKYLNFKPSFICSQQLSFDISPPTIFSSILSELHVNVGWYGDCFDLLDGRFNQLHTRFVNIYLSIPNLSKINNMKNLPNLKCLSLSHEVMIVDYDESLLELLNRMPNLEKLELDFAVERNESFIDGNQLRRDIMNKMPRLKKFGFNIRSIINLHNQIDLPTNEDIQNTFRDFDNNQIISCVNYFRDRKKGECHIYSYPFKNRRYVKIANNFPGGIFKCVREVSLFDEHPFDHEFFLRIQKSFPFMNKLSVTNRKPQNNNQQLSIIEYLHLTHLDLTNTHHDYAEQFLLDTKMCLPNNVHLYIDYKSLKRVTHNFRRDATKINCSKVRYVCTNDIRFPKHFRNYFLETDTL